MWNNVFFSNLIRFIVLVLVQIFILNNVNFLGYVNPYLYVLYILLFPFTGNKSVLIFTSFLLGLSIDMFGDSGGIHAAASVLIAFIRPTALRFAFGVSYEYNMVRLNKTPMSERITYITTLVFIHHLVLFSLEIFNLQNILLILKSTLFSGILSCILIIVTLLLFSTKK